MGFRNDAYATFWETKLSTPTVLRARISTSKKNKNTGEYETDFSGFVSFVGAECAAKAEKLNPKDRIKLNSVDVTVKYDKEKNTSYTNYTIFSFDIVDSNASQRPQVITNIDDGEPEQVLPF